ncbi:hypothetical protein [Synechococcus sp. A15-44]|uniref:hypothetical protein n=1 Tax=Synechococcus sp. A15-44 TaxID=1050646 RepID=UPI001648C6EC|nr:hypothetical protein [Synechococcus sp. A15-44]QNI65465.1 hypothetical protein SynA1544_02544 [Synechococcus sp. A15-44]
MWFAGLRTILHQHPDAALPSLPVRKRTAVQRKGSTGNSQQLLIGFDPAPLGCIPLAAAPQPGGAAAAAGAGAGLLELLAGRREQYLSRGEREPEAVYRRRVEATLPSGFFRDALRTFAGMLASSHWRELPASLQAAISDVDGRGTDLGVFLEAADLLVLRDGAALVGVIPPQHQWPSEGDRQQALRSGDRLSLPRLLLLERRDVLDWRKPDVRSLPVAISWRERRVDGLPTDGEDAPRQGPPLHPWIYRTASLSAAGPGGPGMHLTTEALVADPQSPTG